MLYVFKVVKFSPKGKGLPEALKLSKLMLYWEVGPHLLDVKPQKYKDKPENTICFSSFNFF